MYVACKCIKYLNNYTKNVVDNLTLHENTKH